MEKKVKLHELDEKEQQERIKEIKKNAKNITKRVLLAIFCSVLILLMVFSLIAGIIWGDDEKDDDHNHNHTHTHAIVEILN